MKDGECYSDVEEEAKEGRNKGREATTDEEVRSPRLTLTPVCGGVPPGQNSPSAAFGVEV